MRLAVTYIGRGLHPREAVISIATKDGMEELSVDERLVNDGSIDIGWPVGQQNEYYLVELPQNTDRGYWRVWVRRDQTFSNEQKLRA